MLTQQIVTDARSYAWLVERNHHKIWQSLPHILENLRLIGDFTNNFNVGLICERCENNLSHKPRTIRHEDPDSLFHGTLHVAEVWRSQVLAVRLKRSLSAGTPSEWSRALTEAWWIPILTHSNSLCRGRENCRSKTTVPCGHTIIFYLSVIKKKPLHRKAASMWRPILTRLVGKLSALYTVGI